MPHLRLGRISICVLGTCDHYLVAGLYHIIKVRIFPLNVHCMCIVCINGYVYNIAIQLLAGVFWPVQSFPKWIQFLSNCFPIALPTEAVISVFLRGRKHTCIEIFVFTHAVNL